MNISFVYVIILIIFLFFLICFKHLGLNLFLNLRSCPLFENHCSRVSKYISTMSQTLPRFVYIPKFAVKSQRFQYELKNSHKILPALFY